MMLIAGSLLLKCAGHMLPLTHPLNKDTIIHRERERGQPHTTKSTQHSLILLFLFISLSLFLSMYREINIKIIYFFAVK